MAGVAAAMGSALIVEDDDQSIRILRLILEREGFRVHEARDGSAAEALIDALPPPAIVTLDVMLPRADGYELLARIRARPGWEAVPVIMLTALSQEKDIVRALDSGANDYLVKPLKLDELSARVRRLVRR
jgi:DNA-binding response OmpR family regulator